MVFSGGVRSFVQVVAVCALALSVLPSIQAKTDKTPAPTQCGISDGDKSAGIQVINDHECANGGLGCYNEHCRYCKVLDTPKSSHLHTCDSYGVAFTNTAPIAVTKGPCEVSTGDVAAGIAAVTDPSCLYGGLGCFKDHCRFCKVTETPQSTNFQACSSLDSTYSAPVVPATVAPTPAPLIVDTTTDAPTTTPTDVPTIATNAPAEVPSGATMNSTCTVVPSAGDVAAGVDIVTDLTCTNGGLGCLSTLCRFCKVKVTPQSDPYMDCALVDGSVTHAPATNTTPDATTATPAVTPSPTDTPVATTEAPISTTATPAATPSPTDTPVATTEAPISTTATPDATTETPASTTQAPATTTDAPFVSTEFPTATPAATTVSPASTTEAPPTPVVSTDAPASTPNAVSRQNTCGLTAAAGDLAVGVHIATDATCSAGGVGCINDLCRFCKVENTTQSAAFVDCSSLSGFTSCNLIASPGDAAVGIRIITDSTCSAGGVGCISDVCRFCKVITSIQSANFIDCTTVDGYTPETPAATTTPGATTPTAPNSATTCSKVASAGDRAVGVDLATDTSCRTGGVGCIDDVCRFCQVTATVQFAEFVNCTSLSNYMPHTEAPVDTTTTTNAPATQASCGLVVSAGDAAVGVSITEDSSCAAGGIGCINNVCRFCKVATTVQSAAFVDCTSIARYSLVSAASAAATTAPSTGLGTNTSTTIAPSTGLVTSTPVSAGSCGLTVSEGDAAVGVNITADSSCQFGGVGCINSVCRFCKVRTTKQSAAFVDCATSASAANTTGTVTEAPSVDVDTSDLLTDAPVAATTAPTKAPVSTVAADDGSREGSDSSEADSDSSYHDSGDLLLDAM